MYMHTLTCGTVLCVCVCSRAKGTVSYREGSLYVHAPTNHKCTQAPTPYAPHKHIPVSVSSLLIILSPKAAIFGLPLTAFTKAQTDLKASKVHFSFKHLWRILFCHVVSLASVIVLWSPLSIMSASKRSKTTFSASISSINRPRNWSRTSTAAWRGQNHGNQPNATPTSQHQMCCRVGVRNLIDFSD